MGFFNSSLSYNLTEKKIEGEGAYAEREKGSGKMEKKKEDVWKLWKKNWTEKKMKKAA